MTRPVRIQRKRVKGWRMPKGAIYVGRPSRWENLARVGEDISYYTEGCTSATATDAVELFERICEAHRAANPRLFEEWIAPLRGHDLACWCPLVDTHGHNVPCHADVLIRLSNQ